MLCVAHVGVKRSVVFEQQHLGAPMEKCNTNITVFKCGTHITHVLPPMRGGRWHTWGKITQPYLRLICIGAKLPANYFDLLRHHVGDGDMGSFAPMQTEGDSIRGAI